MKIIYIDGRIEDKPDNYRHQWSPAKILALEIPPEHHPIVGNPYRQYDRRSPAQLKTKNQKRTAIARQAKAEKRKSKSKT
jgi:hypothetical protein